MRGLGFTFAELAKALCAEHLRGDTDARVSAFDVDSRRITPGQLFVALKGERTDGHRFVAEAAAKGAYGAVVSERLDTFGEIPERFSLLYVPDTQRALEKLGSMWRGSSDTAVIGITGSVGKTTAKNILAHILGDRFDVLKSPANWNTEIGVPLTFALIKPETEVVVIEMAMRGRGQIARLSDIARPNHAVITNVRLAHLELLGSRDEITKAKLEIVRGLEAQGSFWINRDEKVLAGFIGHNGNRRDTEKYLGFSGEIRSFSLKGDADVYASDIELAGLEGSKFELVLPDSRARVNFPLLGKGAIAGAVSVAGIAWKLGLDASEISSRLSTLESERGRLYRIDKDDLIVVDDSYNAGPDSVLNALGVARSIQIYDGLPVGLVIGDMLELGISSRAEHERIGRSIAALNPAFAVIAGDFTEDVMRGLSDAPFPISRITPDDASNYDDRFIDGIVKSTASHISGISGRIVLFVKGSRSLRLERIVNEFAVRSDDEEGGVANAD